MVHTERERERDSYFLLRELYKFWTHNEVEDASSWQIPGIETVELNKVENHYIKFKKVNDTTLDKGN